LAEVQEACSIIQGAAHEDANIIFGAVLDEKAKDAVKITVIATGFRDSDIRRRQAEMQSGYVVSSFTEEPEPEYRPEPARPPIVMEEAAPRQMAATHTEGVAVDTLRDAMIANFEKEDLDVPAFLRKRTEIS
jgi:cell division protein FtsZ